MPAKVAKAKKIAPELPEELAVFLPRVRRKPLTFVRNGKPFAVMLSIRDYREKMDFLAEKTNDPYWKKRAKEAWAYE